MTPDRPTDPKGSPVAERARASYDRAHATRAKAQRAALLAEPPRARTTLPGEVRRRPRWLLRAGLVVAGLAAACSALAWWGAW